MLCAILNLLATNIRHNQNVNEVANRIVYFVWVSYICHMTNYIKADGFDEAIINSAKIEVDFIRITGANQNTGFIKLTEGGEK